MEKAKGESKRELATAGRGPPIDQIGQIGPI
jgi:hypothetical protein